MHVDVRVLAAFAVWSLGMFAWLLATDSKSGKTLQRIFQALGFGLVGFGLSLDVVYGVVGLWNLQDWSLPSLMGGPVWSWLTMSLWLAVAAGVSGYWAQDDQQRSPLGMGTLSALLMALGWVLVILLVQGLRSLVAML